MNKILNKNQTICLLSDILANDVKKEGQYIYRDYVINVHKFISQIQKNKIEARNARLLYYARIADGLCVKCGIKHNSGMVKCLKCNNRANKLLKKRKFLKHMRRGHGIISGN